MTDDELLEIRQAFAIESTELLTDMESSLLALELKTSDAGEFNRLFRAIHTIKGSASIVGFEPAEQFCHSIEHLMVRIREGEFTLTSPLVALLLQCHDHIRCMLEQYCNGSDEDCTLNVRQQTLLDKLLAWHTAPEASPVETYEMLDASYFGNASDEQIEGFGFFDDMESAPTITAMPITPVIIEASEPDMAALSSGSDPAPRDQRAIRVDAVKLDQLSDLIVELVTASSVLEADVRRLNDVSTMESATHLSDLIKRIQEKSMVFRMIPVQTLFRRFQRIIHDIGKSSGKDIRLVLTGGETELDKAVAEKLNEPLLHLVRNAVDHGIESVERRKELGKPLFGTIRLQAFHDAGTIVITVTDDGQGINLDRVAQKAMERGLMKRDVFGIGKEVLNYIFEPGFSTLDKATMLSGRGVGMDVVKKTVESLRGSIDVTTSEGEGSTFRISIPLSLSLVDGFMISLADNLYIVPMECIMETLELPDINRPGVMVNGCLQIRGEILPCLDLRELLEIEDQPPVIRHVVVVRHGGRSVGIIADRLHGEIKTVVKPLGRFYRNVQTISGASILGDGSIALFLEVGKLLDMQSGRTFSRH